MSLNETNGFDYLSSIKTSRIPRFLTKIISDIPVKSNAESINQNSIKFWTKFSQLNLNGKQSRIPVLKSRNNCTEYKPTISEQKSGQNDKQNINNNLENKDTNLNPFPDPGSISDCKVKLRPIAGRTHSAKGWTQSEPIESWQYILGIVRSHLSADNKFRAIKRYRDKRLGILSQMDSYSDDTFDDKVREWVDSGYISNSTHIGQHDDVFNEAKCEAPVSTSNPMQLNSRELGPKRRSLKSSRALDLIALNNKYNSFNSDISMSSISSIESLLESRREDPEDLLLALGFGYQAEDQNLNRIPQRFFESPSSAKGVNPENISKTSGIKDIPSLSSSTSFPSTDYRERSYSCGRVGERFKKRLNSKEALMKFDLPEIITSSCSTSSLQTSQTESILNPANRKFLESQGKSDQQNQLSSTKRLIIGSKAYKLDIDGELLPKTPSPQPTPVPTDSEMETSEGVSQTTEQNICDNNDNSFYQSFKRKQFRRQNCVSDQDFDDSTTKYSMNEMASDLSSSTTTLVGTVVSGSIENPSNSTDYFDSYEKRNEFVPTDSDLTTHQNNRAIEAALVVAIQSLRLSLDFYRYQSMKLAKLSAQKYNQSASGLTENDLISLSKIHELRESIHKEIIDMDRVLNRHLQVLHTCDVLDSSFISQAQVFTAAVKKVKQLLKEQQNIYSRIGLIIPENI